MSDDTLMSKSVKTLDEAKARIKGIDRNKLKTNNEKLKSQALHKSKR